MRKRTSIAIAAMMFAVGPASAELREVYVWHNDGRFAVRQSADPDGSQACMFMRTGNGKGFFLTYWLGDRKYMGITLLDSSSTWTPGKMQITIGNHTWNAVGEVTASHPEQLVVSYPWTDAAFAPWRGFIDAIAIGWSMTISSSGDAYGRGAFAYTVPLDGSAVALSKMRECVSGLDRTVTPRAPARPYTPPAVRREIIL